MEINKINCFTNLELVMANPHAPVGFRFRPSDQEIIRFFLYTMVVKREPLMLLYNNFVHVEDLFSDKEPWEIWEDYGGDQLCDDEGLYFFCELKRLNLKGSHIHRKIGVGVSWSQCEPPKLVYYKDGNGNVYPIGRKRKFRYENQPSKEHGRWHLDEYSLVGGGDGHEQNASENYYNASSSNYDSYFVICQLRKNERSYMNKKNGR